MIIFFWDDDV